MFRFARRATSTTYRTAAVLGMAFGIRESAPYETPSKLKIAPNQLVEKQFRLDTEAGSAAKIRELVLSTPGYTRVTYNALGRENVIRVSSDSEEILDAIEVVGRGSHGLEVRTRSPIGSKGHLLTEIFLAQPAEVQDVVSTGNGVIVLEEEVVVNNRPDADLKISHTGNGRLYALSTDSVLRSLNLSLSGSGELHLNVPTIKLAESAELSLASSGTLKVFAMNVHAADMKLAVAGSGDIRLSSQTLAVKDKLSVSMAGSGDARVFSSSLNAPEINLSIAGSGDIRVAAQDQLVAKKMSSSIMGSGDISIASRLAQCESHDISIAGSGDVDAGSILVKATNASIMGSGDSIVQVSDELKYSKMGSGSITHVGDAPRSVSGSDGKGIKQTHRYDLHALIDKLALQAPSAIPAKEEAFDHITVRSNSIYEYHVEIRSWSELFAKAREFFGLGPGPTPPPAPLAPPAAALPVQAGTQAQAAGCEYRRGESGDLRGKLPSGGKRTP